MPSSKTLLAALCTLAVLLIAFALSASAQLAAVPSLKAIAYGVAVLTLAPLLLGSSIGALPCAVGKYQRLDSSLIITQALPNGAATTTSDGIDTGCGPNGDQLADVEYELIAPALTTALLPDTQTVSYKIQHAASADFSDVATLIESLILQTGAGGAGAASVTRRIRLPHDAARYIRVAAVKTGAANASAASLTFQPRF